MKSYYQLVHHEGNQDLFRAIEMSVAALTGGQPFHIHTEGLRGTGKTTIMRAAASMLPPITRIKHCLYNCDPAQPHCPEHRGLTAEQIESIGVEEVPRPFLEISHGAKISTIIGSIDLTKLTDSQQPVAALLPGTIPQANRGIVFVDEINRLADASPEIADVLLDVMGTKPGRIQIEEAGLAIVEMPVNVTIWAASNPDEEPGALAQIRKQLSDRFDLSVCMGRPNQVESVLDILMNRTSSEPAMTQGLFLAGMGQMTTDAETKKVLASIYVDYGLESLRAVEALETAAKLQGLLNGHDRVLTTDVAQVVPLVLAHRTDPATIANILSYLEHVGDPARQSRPMAAEGGQSGQLSPVKHQHTAGKTRSRLAEWWNRLRDSLSPAGQQPNRDTGGILPEPPEGRRAGSVTRRQQIADPAGLTIAAPPKIAVPLAQLNLDEFVSTEEKGATGR